MQVHLEHVGYRVRNPSRDILNDVCLSTPEAGRVAVIGPSGSGKTTLLGLIGGLLKPHSGSIAWNDRAKQISRKDITRSVSWIFQHPPLVPGRPAIDNVLMGRPTSAEFPNAARRESAKEMLELVGIAPTTVPAGRLSGGEQQRVAIARVMFSQPRLILADEPTGQLDKSTTSAVIGALLSAVPFDTTLIAATHDPLIAKRFDVVWEVGDGRIHVKV